jgi:hypothetical protein
MPTFAVQLAEIRWLTAYIDAKNSTTAIRRTRRTWSRIEHSAPLPFELQTAKLMPQAAAKPIRIPAVKKGRSRHG